jgi:murein DD-endopeptidase MepM/ murein hydrolase activator NlpD
MTLAALSVAVVAALLPSSPWWSWPVGTPASPPVVVSEFDPPEQRWLAGHRGVDLAAPPGSRVVAAADGVVVHAGPLAGRGVVSIRHPSGLRTTYEPLLAEVVVGAVVGRGQVIGTLATWATPHGGCAASSCLHWGARDGRHYVDPLQLMTPPRVRLLPRTPQLRRSGSGVGLLVGTAQVVDRDMGVALRGRDRGVPEKLLHRAKISAAFE